MDKRAANPEHRLKAESALRESADRNGGQPDIAAVCKEVGVSRDTLQRWWAQIRSGTRPNLRTLPPPADPASPTLDPSTCRESEYHLFCWVQLAAELAQATSDVARSNLLNRQDKIFAALRAALDAEAKAHPASAEEAMRQAEIAAQRLPPAMAERVLRVFRTRGLVA